METEVKLAPSTEQLMYRRVYEQLLKEEAILKIQYTDWQGWCVRIKAKNVETLESWRRIDAAYLSRLKEVGNLKKQFYDLLQEDYAVLKFPFN